MDRFLKLPIEDKIATFNKAETEIGFAEDIIEKDFWVCFTLKLLFELDEIKDHLTFKGGTSLSKIFKVINRFSEDIDVSVERTYLGFKDDKDPAKASAKQAKRLIEELGVACQKFVNEKLLNALDVAISAKLGTKKDWKLEIDNDDNDGQTISPYILEVLPDSFKNMDAEIRVLNIERTFWEKATILHKYAHYPENKTVPERQSRHFFDFYCLLLSDGKNKALANIDLLEKVAAHKILYFKAAWANYETAKIGSLKLVPEEKVMKAMENDYKAMSEMFPGDVPEWGEIIDEIKKFEKDLNLRKK
jgi:hypothetical protein